MATNCSTNTSKDHRARWAAIGAAVAVSLGAGGIGLVQATSPEGASAYVPITPCRLVDTRPAPDNVGPRSTPLGAAETYTLNGWASAGGTGNCTAAKLPDGTTGLELNVTAVGPTQNTNLRFWPADETMPLASNLNPSVGQPATPNSVSVTLSPTGQFSVFNFQGSVNVVIDVVGHYTDHNHDDRYYTQSQSDDRYYTKSQSDGRYYTQTESDARYLAADDALNITGIAADAGVSVNWGLSPPNTIAELNVATEAPSIVTLLVTGEVSFGSASTVDCDVTTGSSLTNSYTFAEPASASEEAFSLHQQVTVGAGTTTFNLNCHATANGATVGDVRFTAMHQPT